MQLLFDGVHEAFHRPSSPLYRWVHGVVWVLIAVSILLMGVDLAMP
ncbi:MAG: hypothetical protein H6741_35485, partial [Alphaproteobacteria bacterium]|nr:hypothetical protein [Alphaproteobacteria bacterium]